MVLSVDQLVVDVEAHPVLYATGRVLKVSDRHKTAQASWSRCWIALCCLALLNIAVPLYLYHSNMVEKQQLLTSFDELQNRHNNLTEQKDQLQSSFDELQTRHNQHTEQEEGEHAVVKECVCRNDWIQWNGHCYGFEEAHMNWTDAEKTCLSQGGNLASIHSKTEHTFIQDLIRSKTGWNRSWIGGYDATGTNGGWLWSDGHRPMTFTDWGGGEPNNWKGGQQNCMLVNYVRESLWDDEYCHYEFPSLCKKTAESVE